MNDIAQPSNRIFNFFSGKTILITGGFGFVGKVLIEKLLRSCPSVKKIYLLARDKNEKNITQRLREMFQGVLFESVKIKHGERIFDKVVGISGDINSPNLGLSLEDRKMLIDEAEIIYHSAANVKFDDSFKSTVLTNVRGTKLMLNLAKHCKKLMLFCYVSTAYCHEDQEIVFEKIYPHPANPHEVIKLCECLEDDVLEFFRKNLLGVNNNNYTFTKALAEALIDEVMDDLPVIITRPSVVLPIWKEPVPGWTDNLNNMIGFLVGGAKGVIRTMYGREDISIDVCFVDIFANLLIVVAYDYYSFKTRRIYHLSAGSEMDRLGVTNKIVNDVGKSVLETQIAFNTVLWYPNVSMTQSRVMHNLVFFLFQLLPAILVDAILFIIGAKPFLIKTQKRIWKSYKLFEYYANRKWNFDNANTKTAQNLLNSIELKDFQLDSNEFQLREYIYDCCLSIRRYLMKEQDEDIPAALRHIKILRYVDLFCKLLLLVGLMYYFCKLIYW